MVLRRVISVPVHCDYPTMCQMVVPKPTCLLLPSTNTSHGTLACVPSFYQLALLVACCSATVLPRH
jgi:hypothetical protein